MRHLEGIVSGTSRFSYIWHLCHISN